MTALVHHAERNVISAQLAQNLVLKELDDEARHDLETLLTVKDARKGQQLLRQGARSMEQYFILEGILKRVVSNAQGKEMILRFAPEHDMETAYAAWRLRTPAPYAVVCVTKARVASLPLPEWVAFIDRHPATKALFEYHVMEVMSEIMAHTITLHLLDGQGRLQRFTRKHRDLLDRIPQKEQALYLNMSAETLSRLRHKGGAG